MPKRVLIPFRHATKVGAYAAAAQAAGMEPVLGDVAEAVKLDGAHGLILMGGTDVNPTRYGAKPWAETERPDDERDQIELDLLDEALRKDIPVLAICRGLQLLNVHAGGTLIQHLSTAARHDSDASDKAAAVHSVSIEGDSILMQIAKRSSWQVNSRHHQAAERVGAELRVVARDDVDGTVEALEGEGNRFVLGVQWHPEDQIRQYPEQLNLFRRLSREL